MKTKLDIYKDAAALALQTINETDTMKLDGMVWDEADSRHHTGKDFDQMKSDFRNCRAQFLALQRSPAPSTIPVRIPLAAGAIKITNQVKPPTK